MVRPRGREGVGGRLGITPPVPTTVPPLRRADARPIVAPPPAQHYVFENASWATYEALLREAGNGPARMNYDDGRLEVTSPLPEQGVGKKMLARLIETLTAELDIPIASFGSTTFRRKDRRKGTEPDDCYCVANEARMRGRKRLNMTRDPRPELVVEIDVPSPSVPREPIYVALGVPEIWRSNGGRVQCLHLIDGRYQPRKSSLSFPFLEPAWLQRFVTAMAVRGATAGIRAFVKWVRTQGWTK